MVHISDYDLEEARSRFASQWHGLLTSGDFNLSLSPEWLKAICSGLNVPRTPNVLVAQRREEVLGFLPYYITAGRLLGVPMTIVELGGNLLSYHQEIVAMECHLELLRECLGRAAPKWHLFIASSIRRDGPTADAMRSLADEVGGTLLRYSADASPYLPINMSWEQFLSSKSAKFRHNRKREEQTLRKSGRLDVRWFETAGDVSQLYDCMMEIESHSWKKSAGIAVSLRPHEQRYYQTLLPFLAERKALFANVLYLDDRPIAYNLCYFWNGKVGQLKTSFHEAYHSLSPGSVAIQIALRRAFELNAKEFDFLGDAQYHKLLWTDRVRHLESHYLFSPRLRSRLIGSIKSVKQALRPTGFHRIIRRNHG